MKKEDWELMKALAELTLKIANDEGWASTDASRVLAELALKAYEHLVHEWNPPQQRVTHP